MYFTSLHAKLYNNVDTHVSNPKFLSVVYGGFAISPPFREKLEPFSETAAKLHLTKMDGHGPHGFEDTQ